MPSYMSYNLYQCGDGTIICREERHHPTVRRTVDGKDLLGTIEDQKNRHFEIERSILRTKMGTSCKLKCCE